MAAHCDPPDSFSFLKNNFVCASRIIELVRQKNDIVSGSAGSSYSKCSVQIDTNYSPSETGELVAIDEVAVVVAASSSTIDSASRISSVRFDLASNSSSTFSKVSAS